MNVFVLYGQVYCHGGGLEPGWPSDCYLAMWLHSLRKKSIQFLYVTLPSANRLENYSPWLQDSAVCSESSTFPNSNNDDEARTTAHKSAIVKSLHSMNETKNGIQFIPPLLVPGEPDSYLAALRMDLVYWPRARHTARQSSAQRSGLFIPNSCTSSAGFARGVELLTGAAPLKLHPWGMLQLSFESENRGPCNRKALDLYPHGHHNRSIFPANSALSSQEGRCAKYTRMRMLAWEEGSHASLVTRNFITPGIDVTVQLSY